MRQQTKTLQSLFHVTTEDALPSILRSGLIPTIGSRSLEAEESRYAVFAFTSREALEDGLSNWLGDAFEDYEGEILIVEFHYSGDKKFQDAAYEVGILEAVPPANFLNILDESLDVVEGVLPTRSAPTRPKPSTTTPNDFEP